MPRFTLSKLKYAKPSMRRRLFLYMGALAALLLVVLIAAVVLVVIGLGRKDKTPNGEPGQVVTPNTPDKPDDTQEPDNDPDNTQQPVDTNTNDPGLATNEPYIDANGLLQYDTKGHYVQADSYQGGGEPDWQLLLVNDWNPLPAEDGQIAHHLGRRRDLHHRQRRQAGGQPHHRRGEPDAGGRQRL